MKPAAISHKVSVALQELAWGHHPELPYGQFYTIHGHSEDLDGAAKQAEELGSDYMLIAATPKRGILGEPGLTVYAVVSRKHYREAVKRSKLPSNRRFWNYPDSKNPESGSGIKSARGSSGGSGNPAKLTFELIGGEMYALFAAGQHVTKPISVSFSAQIFTADSPHVGYPALISEKGEGRRAIVPDNRLWWMADGPSEIAPGTWGAALRGDIGSYRLAERGEDGVWRFLKKGNPDSESGIKFVYGILGKGASRVSEVQSVLLDKARYTVTQAKKWLQDHGFKCGSVDEGGPRAEYLRFRQQDPGKYHSMRTGEAGAKNPEIDDGIEGEYDEPQEPEDGDLITEDHHHFYQDGKLAVVVPPEHDWEHKVRRYMDEEKYWPNVWFLSDHGNYHPLTFSSGNPILGMGALPPHALIQHPNGVWSFVGRVDARLSYLRKDGSEPSEEELRKVAQFGPGLMGLKTRVWPTQEAAEQAAAELGIKVGQVSPYRKGNPESFANSRWLKPGDDAGYWTADSRRNFQRRWRERFLVDLVKSFGHRVFTRILPRAHVEGRKLALNAGLQEYLIQDQWNGSLVNYNLDGVSTGREALAEDSPSGRMLYLPEHKIRDSIWRSNPESESQSAAVLYEQFHGRPSSETLEYREEIEVPDELAGLGDLTEIKVATMSGLDVTLSFEHDPPKLCSTPDGKQLHIIGGDGSLPLDKLKMDGSKWLRDSMVIGVLYELTYRTEKDFHRFSLTDYFHKFADPKEKRSEVEPMLIYDSVNKQLSVSGGQYEISRPGIEG